MSTTSDVSTRGTILGVWAHPDAEVFLSAGLMILAARAGHRVICVSATSGGHGAHRPDEGPPERPLTPQAGWSPGRR